MVKLLLVTVLALACSGCVSLGAWWAVPGHQGAVAAVAAIGGAAYAVEEAAGGALDLGKKIKETTKGE